MTKYIKQPSTVDPKKHSIVTSQGLLPHRGNSCSIYWDIGIFKFVIYIFH